MDSQPTFLERTDNFGWQQNSLFLHEPDFEETNLHSAMIIVESKTGFKADGDFRAADEIQEELEAIIEGVLEFTIARKSGNLLEYPAPYLNVELPIQLPNHYNKPEWSIVERPLMFLADGTTQEITAEEVNYDNSYCLDWPCSEDVDLYAGCQEFHTFHVLPAEIRRIIWYFALPPPRVTYLDDRPREEPCSSLQELACGDLSVFPLLTTCHESREVFLETYSMIKTKAAPPGVTWQGITHDEIHPSKYNAPQPLGYFDLKSDTLVVSAEALNRFGSRGKLIEVSGIQHLGFAHDPDDILGIIAMVTFARQIPTLKTLDLVLGGKPLLYDTYGGIELFCARHLLPIDWRLDGVIIWDFPERYSRRYSSKERRSQIIHRQEEAAAFRKEYLDLTAGETDFWGPVKFSVSVVGVMRAIGDRDHPSTEVETIYLKPKIPYYCGVIFKVEKPLSIRQRMDRDQWRGMTIEEFDGKTLCYPDGSLLKSSKYERFYDGITELFIGDI